jgi:50S ribosome-binding GTPase
MDYDFYKLLDQSKRWAQEACTGGWLSKKETRRLESVQAQTPASLFSGDEQRPLVVAFFGGTGVGKSSLLNRLAGQTIARVGVERPTSREISMYHHQSLHISCLPAEFPVEKIRVGRHQDDDKREVLWIDMPDIDSTEEKNRTIVLEWLPHIDVLIYVVSPERYLDDREWRLLRSVGAEHAWIFVMNHWDEGEEAQLADFEKQLIKGGFTRPIVLRTDCRPQASGRAADDFDELERIIQSLANTHTINQLELRGLRLRLEELERILADNIDRLGTDQAFSALKEQWETVWNSTIQSLQQGLEWPMQQVSGAFVTEAVSLLPTRAKKEDAERPGERGRGGISALWDEWTQTRFDDALDRFIIDADANGLPSAPFKAAFEPFRAKAGRILRSQAEQSLRAALANPGNVLQRFFLRLASFCATVLPLCAIGWVGYQVFDGYYTSSFSDRPYLGTNFAIHSTLLIVLSWLLPWFVYRKLRPSTEKVALKGVRNGIALGFDLIKEQVDALIEETLERRKELIEAGEKLVSLSRQLETEEQPPDKSVLARMLPQQVGVGRRRGGWHAAVNSKVENQSGNRS